MLNGRHWTEKQDLNLKVERRLRKEEQIEQWERTTLQNLRRTTELVHTFAHMRNLAAP